MAFELVTGHAAEAHITAEQVSRFIQGITVIDDTTVYRLNQGNDAALSVDTLTLTIATGETILHGFHSTNEDSLDITLDATTNASYSRIDKIVMEVLQDDTTGVQYTSILTVQGEESTTPTAPDTPSSSGSDTITLLAVGLIATVTVTDSIISAWTDNTLLYAGSYVTEAEMDIVRAEVPWYATSSTAASTTAKVATCNQSGFSLVTGAKVIVKFDYTNTATAPTLNVNSTGAIDIVAYGTTAPDLFWVAGDVVEFTYNGTSWVMHPTQGQISELNTNLTLTYCGYATGTNSCDLPSSFNDVWVQIDPNSQGNYYRAILIPQAALSSSNRYFYIEGYANSQYAISISTSSVVLHKVVDNGTDVTSNSKIYVYTR